VGGSLGEEVSGSAQKEPCPSTRDATTSTGNALGFPPDFVGSYSFLHLASSLSRLWSLSSSVRFSFHGGWFESSIRPLVVEEEWPPLPRVASVLKMDPKGRNPNWDWVGSERGASRISILEREPEYQLEIEAKSR
jgi:hypothetical protein